MSRPSWMLSIWVVAACQTTQRSSSDAVDAWMLCRDECDSALTVLVANGDASVHWLAQAMAGPSPDLRARKQEELAAGYRRVPQPQVSQREYVSYYLDNFVARHQMKAAEALGRIATPKAAAALRNALERDDAWPDSTGAPFYRADVRREIEMALALAEAQQGLPEPGFARPVVVADQGALFDTITVQSGASTIDANTVLQLVGSPFPADLVVGRWRDSIRFVVVGRAGLHVLRLDSLGTDERSFAGSFRITSTYSEGRSLAEAPNLAPLDSSRWYARLSDGFPTAFFRIQLGSEMHLVPARGWELPTHGSQEAFRAWNVARSAEPPVTLAQVGAVTGRVLDFNGGPISDAQLTIVGTSIGARTDGTGAFTALNVPAGTHELQARKLGYLPPPPKPVQIQAGRQTAVVFVLVPDAGALVRYALSADWAGAGHVALIAFDCDSAEPPATRFVSGSVLDDRGQPLDSVEVRIAGAVRPNEPSDVTDVSGHFMLRDVRRDSVNLVSVLNGRRIVSDRIGARTWGACLARPDSLSGVLSFPNPDSLVVGLGSGGCRLIEVVRCSRGGASDLVRLRAVRR